ncbi:MAG: hypothetical protein H8E98_07035, partial [Bacteroidetes bacterium]|nr:hypothetical protein [Bacteroidota bacterium]
MPVTYKYRTTATYLWLIVFIFIFPLSPIISDLISIPGNYLYLFPLALFIFKNHKLINFDLALIIMMLIIIMFAFIPAIYYEAPKYLLVPIYMLIFFPVMTIIKTEDWRYIISKVSLILIFFEILAIISFL